MVEQCEQGEEETGQPDHDCDQEKANLGKTTAHLLPPSSIPSRHHGAEMLPGDVVSDCTDLRRLGGLPNAFCGSVGVSLQSGVRMRGTAAGNKNVVGSFPY
jgi:hypothetical protein